MIKISSLSNPLIKEYLKLHEAKERNSKKKYLIEGYHLVSEAIKNKVLLEVLISNPKDEINNLPNYLVSDEIIKKLSKTLTPQGIIGICKMKDEEPDLSSNYLILDEIQDPGNLGTLLRSALGFGIKNVLLANTVDVYNDKVLRSAQGAHFYLNVQTCNLEVALQKLQNNSYYLYGTAVDKGSELTTILPKKTLWNYFRK